MGDSAALLTWNRESDFLFQFLVFPRFVQVVCCVLPNKGAHKHANVALADGAKSALNGVYGKVGGNAKAEHTVRKYLPSTARIHGKIEHLKITLERINKTKV